MKNKLKVLMAFSFVMLSITVAFCDNFTVKVPSTTDSNGLFKPIKAGGSFQFQISVKNNDTLAWTVSIDKALLGEVETWVSIDNNSLELTPDQQRDFLVTISVPTTALDVNYTMNLYFNGFLNSNHNTTDQFFYDTQTIIVDNSVPQTPTFTLSQTSKTVTVNNWTSYDTRSSTYTQYTDFTAKGIKNYTVTLKKADNTIVGTVTKLTTDYNYYTFSNLISNTVYKASVTATDLAGNTSTKEVAATTAPAPPILSSRAQSFCNITLNWTAISGATTYKLYNATVSPNTLIATTSNTSFVVSGLTSGTTYKFFAKAYNSSGLGSDAGTTFTIPTLTVPAPTITGPDAICPSGATLNVSNLPTGCTLLWSLGSGLSLISSTSNSATIKSTSNVQTYVTATFNSGCGTKASSKSVAAGTPKPGPIFIEFEAPPGRFTALIEGVVAATTYKWYLDGILKFTTPEDIVIFNRKLNNCGYGYSVDVAAVNSCGTSLKSHTVVYELPCDGESYTVYPNPATSEITISQSADNTAKTVTYEDKSSTISSIRIVDYYGSTCIIEEFNENTTDANIDISNLKTGLYTLIVNEETNPESYSFVKN